LTEQLQQQLLLLSAQVSDEYVWLEDNQPLFSSKAKLLKFR
jgi:hypothetical protein